MEVTGDTANTLSYYHKAENTAVKSFIVQAPGSDPWNVGITEIYGSFSFQNELKIEKKNVLYLSNCLKQ